MDYDSTHTWAHDVPICSADHFFKNMVPVLDPEVLLESTTGIFQWIAKVYQTSLLDGIKELHQFTNVSINKNHPALTALRALFTECKKTHGDPGFPVWEEPVATPAAPDQDDPGAKQDLAQDPGSVASAAPDQETMVQVLADAEHRPR
eukprot:4150924-Pyramimonas_sp.AAC.1